MRCSQQSLHKIRIRTDGSKGGAVEQQVAGLFNLSTQGRSLLYGRDYGHDFTLASGLDSVGFVLSRKCLHTGWLGGVPARQ